MCFASGSIVNGIGFAVENGSRSLDGVSGKVVAGLPGKAVLGRVVSGVIGANCDRNSAAPVAGAGTDVGGAIGSAVVFSGAPGEGTPRAAAGAFFSGPFGLVVCLIGVAEAGTDGPESDAGADDEGAAEFCDATGCIEHKQIVPATNNAAGRIAEFRYERFIRFIV